jgi:hypothetical protein
MVERGSVSQSDDFIDDRISERDRQCNPKLDLTGQGCLGRVRINDFDRS